MAYNSKSQFQIIPVTAALNAAADAYTLKLNHPMSIKRVEFQVETSVTGNPVVSLDYTPVGGARTEWSEVSLVNGNDNTVNAEPASPAPNPLSLGDGDILHFEVKTAGTGGDGKFIIYYEMIPDVEVA